MDESGDGQTILMASVQMRGAVLSDIGMTNFQELSAQKMGFALGLLIKRAGMTLQMVIAEMEKTGNGKDVPVMLEWVQKALDSRPSKEGTSIAFSDMAGGIPDALRARIVGEADRLGGGRWRRIMSADLGPCCACEKTGAGVRNIMMLDKKCPTPGRGWGCVQCGLPNDGAVAVLCDRCLDEKRPHRFACVGYPGTDGRVPIEQLAGGHEHDMSQHPEAAEIDERLKEGAPS